MPRTLFSAALFLAASAAHAQPAAPEHHRVAVTHTGGQCTYTIQGQADQDEFVVEPGGTVAFNPGASLVRVEVLPDSSGIEGGEGRRAFWVPGGRTYTFPVRTDLDRLTRHEVVIECCTDRRRRRSCPAGRLVRATPASLTGSHHDPAGAAEPVSGPSASGPPATTGPPVLGPRMVVVE